MIGNGPDTTVDPPLSSQRQILEQARHLWRACSFLTTSHVRLGDAFARLHCIDFVIRVIPVSNGPIPRCTQASLGVDDALTIGSLSFFDLPGN